MKFLISTTSLALIMCIAFTPLSPALAETSTTSQTPAITSETPETEAHEPDDMTDEEETFKKTPEETDLVVEVAAETSVATSSTNSSELETQNDVDDIATSSTQESASSSSNNTSDTSAHTGISASTDKSSTTAQHDAYSDSDATVTSGGSTSSVEQVTETTASSPGAAGTTSATNTNAAPAASAAIRTGVSVATANIINLLNSNFINSEGAIVLLDILNEQNEAIDLREAILAGNITCSLTYCNSQGVVVQIENDASIDNTIVVSANTGENTISDIERGEIVTGDAYANANIVNVANANLINSQYLLAILNAFSNFNNDIIFPGLATYMSQSTPSQIGLTNTATVANTINTNATTGNNSIDGSNGAIQTGQATTGVNLFNQLNSSLIGGDSVSIMLRVHGAWNGEVFGLPEGVEMIETNGGYLIDFPGLLAGARTLDTDSSVNATNTVRINNTISVDANTGTNQIHQSDTALISTGNAYAGANVINVANANVIGRNWMLGIINIYGNFTGNLAFGRPDIWVGGAVEVPHNADNGNQVTYTYTVTNKGDSRARQVLLQDVISPYMTPADSSLITDGKLQWQLGTLEAGETKTVSYIASIANTQDRTAITNVITVEGYETDNNLEDNTEIVTFFTNRSSGSQATRPTGGTSASAGGDHQTINGDSTNGTENSILDLLKVTRQPLRSTLDSSNSTSTQTIQLVNTSGKRIPGVIFTDKLHATNGSLAQEQVWDLGTILPNEEITLQYAFSFSAQAPTGVYTFSSYAENADGLLQVENNGQVIFSKKLLSTFTAQEMTTDMTVSTAKQSEKTAFSLGQAISAVAGMSTSTNQKLSLFPITQAADLQTTGPVSNSSALLLLEIFTLIALMYIARRIYRRKSVLQ